MSNILKKFGCTICRLVAKIAGQVVVEDMAVLLSPRLTGYRVHEGMEAVVYEGKKYLKNLPIGHVLLNFNFRTAFNLIRWD